MAYDKQHDPWRDSPITTTPITADDLNGIEDGIVAAADVADAVVIDLADHMADTSAHGITGGVPSHASTHQDGGADELALDGSQITAGTVADARIASTIARDSEVTSAISTHAGATDPHGDRAAATTAISTHAALTTTAHGITSAGAALTGAASAAAQRTALGLVIGTNVQAYSAALAGTTASFLTADETKLDGIEALADVTDTTNVEAAKGQIICRWSGSAWDTRPVGASFGVCWLSTNDAAAPAPTDVNLVAGDVWYRHPDAV